MSTPALASFDPPHHEAHPEDDDVATLSVTMDQTHDAVALLDGLIDGLAVLRHATDDPGARAEIMAASSSIHLAWAHARLALTVLSELLAVQPSPRTGT